MKKMRDYTIYCTPEQTERAYKLGAPIRIDKVRDVLDEYSLTLAETTHDVIHNPTAEQMRGWLREKGYIVRQVVYQHQITCAAFDKLSIRIIGLGDDYNKAVLEEIDAALDYLEKGE